MSQHSHMYNDRRWRRLRAIQLEAQPLCEICMRDDKVTVAVICDHITPHKGDVEKFWAGPFQSLCKYHHDVKTVMEDGGLNSGGQAWPEWLPTPACPVVVVTGPPGAGKTTYAKGQAGSADEVIDLDDCFAEVTGTHGHTANKDHLGQALRLRNKKLANLASKKTGKAYLIVSAPSMQERTWWIAKLGATHTHIDPGMDVCLQRIAPSRKHLVRDWYAKQKANRWAGPKRPTECTADGIPTDPAHPWADKA